MAMIHCNKVANFHIDSIGAASFQKTGFTITNNIPGSSTVAAVHTITTVAETGTNLDFNAFTLNSANNELNFYVYFKIDKVDKDPSFADRVAIAIDIVSSATDEAIAEAIVAKFTTGFSEGNHELSKYFTATNITNVVTLTNLNRGEAEASLDGGDTAYNLVDAQDGTDAAIVNLKTITGWVWATKGGGTKYYKRKKYMKLVLNLDDPSISWYY